MELRLSNLSDACQSLKSSNRKKAVIELSGVLYEQEAVQILHRNANTGRVSWSVLFNVANKALILESECWKNDEGKGSALVRNNREISKTQFSALISNVLKKANEFSPTLKCDDVTGACVKVLSDPYLRKNFGTTFSAILRDYILPVRKYRTKLRNDQWEELFELVLDYLKSIAEERNNCGLQSELDLMDKVIQYGCRQSHLSIEVKNKLLPFLTDNFDVVYSEPANQEILLTLVLSACNCVSRETRSGICLLGESILASVIKMFDLKQGDQSPRNKLVVDFLLFQMQCHHPNGAKEGSDASYACNWNLWNDHLRSMYRAVFSMILRRSSRLGYTPFSDAFLDLSVALCYQLFDKGKSTYEASMSIIETQQGPAFKRRKCLTSIEEVFDELQSCRKNPSWPLISLVSRILEKRPELFQEFELKLLEILCDMLCNCNCTEAFTYIYSSCEHLMKAMSDRSLDMDMWLRVWELISRSAVNQNACQPLLQTLIAGGVPSIAGLELLIRTYQSSSIPLSNGTLQTLITLLSYYHLPENSGCINNVINKIAMEELPMSCARAALLKWLCSNQQDVAVDTQLLAKVLALLVVKTKHDPSKLKLKRATTFGQLKSMSLETVYSLNVFEGGLLQPPTKKSLASNGIVSAHYVSASIVDQMSMRLLEDLMRERYVALEQVLTSLQENTSSTSKGRDSFTLKVELACRIINYARLMLNLMSFLMEYGVITADSFLESYFDDGFKKAMNILKPLLPDILKVDDGKIFDTRKTCDVLELLCLLYGNDLLPPLSSHLCEETSQEIIVPIVDLFSSNIECDSTAIFKSSLPIILEDTVVSDADHIRACCLRVLTLYAFPTNSIKFIGKQKSVTTRIFAVLSDSDVYNLASEPTFMMIYQSLSIMLSLVQLDQEKHVKPILLLMQLICKHWCKDAEASAHILCLLKNVFTHATGNWERCASVRLLAPFKNRQFGPEFTVQFLSCIEELLKVDQDSKWAKWHSSNVSSFSQSVDFEVPREALRKFEDENSFVAIVEEAVFFLLSPFHEVRLAVVPSVVGLLAGLHHSSPWMQTMFERLSVMLRQLLIIKEENASNVDETSNRTAVVLHILVAIIRTSVKCYNQAILLVLSLVKEKKINLDLAIKVFSLLVKAMNLRSIQSFLGKSLPYLLQEWLSMGFDLKDFPFALLNFSSFSSFLNHFKCAILPVVCKSKEQRCLLTLICQEIDTEPSAILEAAFPSVFASFLPCLADGNSASNEARSQYNIFTSVVGLDRVKDLALLKIQDILIELTKLVWDPCRHEVMLGLDPSSTPPRPPYISYDDYIASLKHLQEFNQIDVDLLVYIGHKKPILFQKVLLQLREDLVASVTIDQSIRALHIYSTFARSIAFHLQKGQFPDIDFFLLSDITYTLLYFIGEYKQDSVKLDICIGSISFLNIVYEQLLPECAKVLNDLLPTIVGWLIPLVEGTNALAEQSFKLLNLLLVQNSTHVKEAIGKLPPFPDTVQFQEINNIHCQLKYQGRIFTLEEEIQHFLNSAGSTSTLASQDTMLYALTFLRKQLCEKKAELADLYQSLVHIRGFSQDCQDSILHQLICKLINLTSSANMKVQIEASRCLGELGPADLTTIVLRPVKGCINLVQGYSDPILCVLVLAAHLASEYMLDHDVSVVRNASCLLESLMLCRGSDSFHSKNKRPNSLESKKISPFIPKQGTKLTSPKLSDSRKLLEMISNNEIWFPSAEIKHNNWITNLASSLITCLSDDLVFRNLSSLCKVKSSFCEEMLPVLFYLGLSYSSDICHRLCTRLGQFFENHCHNTSTMSQTPNLSATPTNIFLDKASVQCMLNVVNYVRLQKSAVKDESICLEVNYLFVASAAQFCSAYLSSIMYMELSCNHEDRHEDFDGTSVSYVDYIYETRPTEGKMLQNLLSNAYQQIGDKDALYGCGSSMLLNSKRRVTQYEYIGKWEKVLLNYDAKLCHSKDDKRVNGLVNALKHSGLVHLLNTFVSSLPPDQNEQVLSAQVECMWRLGEWGKPLPPKSKALGFEWNQYSALQAIRDGNKSVVNECIQEGRVCVLKDLAYSSLEICKNIYKPLAQLQSLQEIEDFVLWDDTQEVLSKWKNQSALPFSDIFLVEPILAQRAKLMENLIFQKNLEETLSQNTKYNVKNLTQLYLDTAVLAREKGYVQIAEQWLHCLSVMPHVSNEDKRRICLEEAQLAWNSCRGSNDVGTTSVACQLLGSLLKELKISEKETTAISPLLPEAYILYGRWMAEARSENPQKIIDDYLGEALRLLKKIPVHLSVDKHLFEAHCYLAHFADLEYQRITAYIKSELFQSKVECMEKLEQEANQANQMKAKDGTADQQRAVKLTMMFSELDKEEIKNTYDEQNQFIALAMRHYLKSMKLGHGENLPVFRMVSLWLENAGHDAVNNLVSSSLEEIQTYKFIVLLPQLAARIGNDMKDKFTKTIFTLLLRCCREHPHHTLSHILALANSYEDFEGKVKPEPEARVLGAVQMLTELKKDKGVNDTVIEMDRVAKGLISLAYAEIPSQSTTKGYPIPSNEKIRQLHNLHNAMLPTISLPVQSDAKYHNIISIAGFDSRYELAGGINRPKKIICVGTDGHKRVLLVKGRDDLRQDAVMQQVFNIMNTLLQNCQETKCRRLLVRTYKIVPLSQRCGVLEWCQNTSPFAEVLKVTHTKYNAQDWRDVVCMKKIESVRNKTNQERLNVFKEICKNFHPAFRFFFTERFPTPAEWFDRRLAYVHSVATNSMVGYILGLGDRHVSNILIDKSTAEMIHIDFGIAFEQGKVLPTPETVPFRLTRDVVDGMGLSGVEGVFRRSCEKTMAVLRRNQEKILTILEVLLYDPLYAWSLTPKMVARRQKVMKNSSRASTSSVESDGKVSSLEKNKMAERVLCRLKEKLLGTEDGPASSVEGQVNRLIQQARDVANLSRLFKGWQAYY